MPTRMVDSGLMEAYQTIPVAIHGTATSGVSMDRWPHARAMKILVPLCQFQFGTERFVARASRRAASTVVSTFFSAVTRFVLSSKTKSMRYPLFSTEQSAPTQRSASE
jgi:hypothetical protein